MYVYNTCNFFHSNGQSVEGADHSTVVQLIRQSGTKVTMYVVSVSEEEARRLEPESAASSSNPGVEYYERRSVPVSIPQTEKIVEDGKEYVVSCLYVCMENDWLVNVSSLLILRYIIFTWPVN